MAPTYKIAVLPGDGIGPEITRQALRVLKLIEQKRDIVFACQEAEFGAAAYFSTGKAFPDATKKACDQADAILKGPIGLSHEESKKYPVKLRIAALYCHSSTSADHLMLPRNPSFCG